MTALNDIQQRIANTRAERGFVTDPIKIHVLLTEEVGEVASELKRTWSKNYDSFDKDRLADELADTFVLLSALATAFNIDLAQAIEAKFFGKHAARVWKTAQGAEDA